VKTLYGQGYDAFLEVGPGAVLTGLVKRIEPQAQTANVSGMETLLALREDGRYLEAV
jgi:[acyl-carrier-protein] S-malonyltransferase